LSLRLRLAVWYAGIATVTIIGIAVGSYSLHGRTEYLDIDRTLSDEAALFSPVLPLLDGRADVLEQHAPTDVDTSLAVYGPNGELLVIEATRAGTPPIDALATLSRDDGPAYDWFLRLLPDATRHPLGAFATVEQADGAGRIRAYALPVIDGDETTGYVLTWSSLVRADSATTRFRVVVFGLALAGIAAIWVSALFTVRIALAPVTEIIAAAGSIARQRAFTHRVPESGKDDEIGRLGSTFNEMLEALEEAYRAQQRFVADAAHELRAPLTAIRGNIELLARVEEMPATDRQEAMTQLEQESLRLSRLVEELLTLARSDAGQLLQLEEIELDAVVLQAVADIGPPSSAAQVEVGVIDPLAVRGDRDRLHQLVTIILDNARKYTADGGAAVIELSKSGRTAIISVVDQGVGISADDLPHVFERFYRADRARSRDPGGSGLGLPIAKWIAEQHGGKISLSSTLGRGTTVTVELPLEGAAALCGHKMGSA
jgi:signal transduction histidine kinase